jgi:hypothetical protein
MKKSYIKPTEKSDAPKVKGADKITILSTKVNKRSMFREPDGDFSIKVLA